MPPPVPAPISTPFVANDFERRALAALDALARGRAIPITEEPTNDPADAPSAPPRRIRPTVAQLLKRRLRRAVVRFLARGGWCREPFLVNDAPVEGRLWERRPLDAMPLTFTRRSLDLISQLAGGCGGVAALSTNESTTGSRPAASDDAVATASLGDRVFFLLTWAALRETPAVLLPHRACPGGEMTARLLAPLGESTRSPAGSQTDISPPAQGRWGIGGGGIDWASDGLTRALFPSDFPAEFEDFDSAASADKTLDFRHWLTPDSQWIVEAMQRPLAEAWRRDALALRHVTHVEALKRAGADRRQLLEAWLRDIDAAGRRDLALWIVTAARRAMDDVSEAESWFLHASQWRLSPTERADALRDALSLFTALERLAQWNVAARRTGFVDEEYAAAQHWLSAWERRDGDAVVARARTLVETTLIERTPRDGSTSSGS